jgi:hypothetical protein
MTDGATTERDGAAREAAEANARAERASRRAVGRALPLVVVGLAIAGLGIAGRTHGAPGVVLGLVALALAGVIAALWASLRTLLGETPLSGADAYALGARHGEEEQKRAVLRALKDLEFERSVGKISDDDYQQLLVAYRAEAKRLLRAIDESAEASRKRAAEIADAHLAALGLGPKGSASEAVATEEALPSEVVATEEASPSEVVATEEAAIASAPADPEAPTDTVSDEGGSKEIPRVQPSESPDSSEVAP